MIGAKKSPRSLGPSFPQRHPDGGSSRIARGTGVMRSEPLGGGTAHLDLSTLSLSPCCDDPRRFWVPAQLGNPPSNTSGRFEDGTASSPEFLWETLLRRWNLSLLPLVQSVPGPDAHGPFGQPPRIRRSAASRIRAASDPSPATFRGNFPLHPTDSLTGIAIWFGGRRLPP